MAAQHKTQPAAGPTQRRLLLRSRGQVAVTRGGARPGAGRKPKDGVARPGRQAHAARRSFLRRMPVHVTLRIERGLPSLRSRALFRLVQAALRPQAGRLDVLLQQFSVQGNHIHLLVDAAHHRALARYVQSIAVRMGPAINRQLGRCGRVFYDRYFPVICRTPSQVRAVRNYIRGNTNRHLAEYAIARHLPARAFPDHAVDPCSSESPRLPYSLPPPVCWLLARDAAARANRRVRQHFGQ